MLLFCQSMNILKCELQGLEQADPPHAPVHVKEAGHTGGIWHGLDTSPAVLKPQSAENMKTEI